MRRLIAVLVLGCGGVSAQKYEAGVFGGAGFLGRAGVSSAPGVSAGVAPGAAAGAFLAQNLYAALGGEVRYEFQPRGPRLSGRSSTASLPGRAHVLQYDLLLHARSRRGRARPYVVLGGGFKLYQGTGGETAWRPLMDVAYLTRTQQWSPMLVAGTGIKWRAARRTQLRIDVRDQVARFPAKLIAPAPGTTLPAWTHDLVPSIGIAWIF